MKGYREGMHSFKEKGIEELGRVMKIENGTYHAQTIYFLSN